MIQLKNYCRVKSLFITVCLLLFCLNLFGQNNSGRAVGIVEPGDSLTLGKRMGRKYRQTKKIKATNLLFSGMLFENKPRGQSWYMPSLFELFPANTIEGFVSNLQFSFIQDFRDERFYTLRPKLRYAFGSRRFYAELGLEYYYDTDNKASLRLSGGKMISQLNLESTLGAFNNTYYTFLLKENFLKTYERNYLDVSHTFSPTEDFLWTTSLSFNQRSPLQNLSRFSGEDSEYTSNAPSNNELANTAFDRHQALLLGAEIRWQLQHQYVHRRGTLASRSKYPSVAISYLRAIPNVFGTDVSYQKLALRFTGGYKLGRHHSGKFLLEAGDFIANDELSFVDFKHFNGRQTVYGDFNLGDFQLLDYYRYSTAEFYLQSHYEHRFNTISIGKRPQTNPVIAVNYLNTKVNDAYWEFSVGVDKLFGNWRLAISTSLEGREHGRTGIRIGYMLDD